MYQLNSNTQIMFSFCTLLQMLRTLDLSKILLKLKLQSSAKILNLELGKDHGLDLEASVKFSLQWTTEAIIWTLMISDGVLSILVCRFLKKKVMFFFKDLILEIVEKLIILISLLILEETAVQLD